MALASLKVCSDADKSFRPHQLKKAESNRNETNDAETQTYFEVEVEVGSVPVRNRFFFGSARVGATTFARTDSSRELSEQN